MSAVGKLCYKSGDGSLAYKHGQGDLIYKAEGVLKTLVTFAWDAAGRDLDICGYWLGAPDMMVGFSHSTSKENESGAYHIEYSGDVTQVQSSEWAWVWMSPWSANAEDRKFRVHFNFFGSEDEYPTSECTVVANQPGVKTVVKRSQACGTTRGSKATTENPYCTVVFDAGGRLTRIE